MLAKHRAGEQRKRRRRWGQKRGVQEVGRGVVLVGSSDAGQGGLVT